MKKQILLIDDDRVFLKYLTKQLETAGHTVTTVEDGVSALNVLTGFTPDIIFLDLILPKIDGDKLCRIIRKMEHLRNCHLVVISAVVAEMSSDVSEIGADAFIAKGPFASVMKHVMAAVDESGRLAATPADNKPKQVLGLEHVSPRQMTRELLSRNRHLKAILESMEEGILEIIENMVVYANSAAVGLIGKPLENILAVSPEELFDVDERQRVIDLIDSADSQMVEIGEARPIELNNRQVTVKYMPVEARKARSIILITDITERKRLELQLQHSQKMEAIGTIASGVAHNFRNTLTGILVNSQVIQENYKNDMDLQEIAGRIDTSVKRGAELVERLMQFARKETKKERIVIDLVAVIAETYQIIRKSFDRKIDIQLDIRHSLPVVGDYLGLSQALMNLFTNAGDAMPAGGVLKIDALRNGQAAIVRISDSGEGMDPETRKRCFDPFFTTKEVGKGTGLGLSTTYGIIKSHNGDVAVVSSSPRGSTFEISLPLADSDSDARKKAIIMGAGQAILVIENASDPNTTTSDLLECLGYRSARVMSVIEAMNKYENLRPDVVLIDASELSEDSIIQLRSITDNNPNAKIVALTDSSAMTPEHSDNGLDGIVKGYLQKPIDLSEASLLISEVLAC
jgi:signal transduction histidine kinase/two-component SAPR family response regulator